VTADNKSRVYGDSNPEFTYVVAPDNAMTRGLYNTDTLTGSLATLATEATNVGTVAITQNTLTNVNNPNYDITFNEGALTISARPITVTADNKSRVYGDSNPEFTYVVAPDNAMTRGLYNTDTLTGSLATLATEATNVGTVAITQNTLTNVNNPNYDITFNEGALTISARPITVTADNKSRVYGDSNPEFTYVVAPDNAMTRGLYSTDTLTGSLATLATEATNVGTVAITQNTLTNVNNPNYDITFNEGALTISARPITVTADNKSRVYGDSNPEFTYVVAPDNAMTRGLYSTDTLTGSLATLATEATNVGTVAITQNTLTNVNNPNYDITFNEGALTISARPITVTADNKSRVYGDSNPEFTYVVAPDNAMTRGLYSTDTLTGSLATLATEATNVGTVAITQNTLTNVNNPNYDITFNEGALTISARPITVTADNKSRVYGDSNPEFTYVVAPDNAMTRGLYSTDTLTGSLATLATEATNVGTVAITQGTLANSNYDITFTSGVLTINRKPITITGITAFNKTYNGNDVAQISTLISAIGGWIVGDDVVVSASGTFSDKNVGDGKTVTLASSYSGTKVDNYTITDQTTTTANITKKAVTASVSAADKVYNGNTTAIATITYSGLIGSETLTTSSSSATFSDKNVAAGKTVTVNSITLGDGTNGGLASNYSVTTGQTATAAITQLSSVTWTGNAGDGLWSSASNWVGSALPDKNNVAAVVISSGKSVTFDSDDVGTIGSTIANSGTLTFNGSNNFTFGNVISGSGALVKSGSNTLTLSTTNTYTGNTTVSAGTLATTHATNTLANNGTITINSGAIYQVDGTDAVGAISGSGSIILANGITLETVVNSPHTFSGVISGGGNLTKSGINTLTLSGSNTFTGKTFIAQRTLSISSDSNLGTAPNSFVSDQLKIANTATLSFADGVTLNANRGINLAPGGGVATITNIGSSTILGVISGAALTKSGSGTLTLSGNNTYTGTTTVNAGILSVATIGNGGVAGNLGQATNAADKIVLSGGTLQYTGATASTNRNFTLTAGTTSKIDVSNAATILTIAGASTNTTGSLTKEGAGTLELTGTNLHTGATTVSTGTLKVNTGVLSNSTISVSEGAFCIGTGCPVTITNIYLVIGSNQSTIYGEEYALAYYFSISPTDHTAGVGSTGLLTSAYYFTAGATNYSPGITDVTGSVTLSTGLTSSLAANTYDLTLTPSLTKSGINFLAGNSKDFIVNKATLTVTADNKSKTYGDANPSLTYTITGYKNSETSSVLTGAPSITTLAGTGSNVGSYTITSAANNLAATNYQFSYANGSLTISTRPIAVTAADKLKIYGDSNPALTYAVATDNGTTRGLYSLDTLTGVLATTADNTTNVGTVAITQGTLTNANNSNYAITFTNGALTIGRATLTVTADNKSKTYGDANPSLTYTITGYKNSETSSVLTGAPTISTAATTGSNVGSYTITSAANNLAATNYQFSYVNGSLTINRKPITVTADNKDKIYGAANPTFTYAVAEDLTGLSAVTGSLATTAGTTTSVGAIDITQGTVTNATNGNYDITFTKGTLTINRKPITVTADNKDKIYGAANPTFTYAVAEDLTGLSAVTGSLATTAGTTTSVGAIDITQGTVTNATNGNYDITFTKGTLTINRKPITVTADNKDKIYGAANPTFTYAVAEDLTGLSAVTGSLATTAGTTTSVGAIDITQGTVTNATNGNYDITFTKGTLTINRKPITISSNTVTPTYDGVTTYAGLVSSTGVTALGLVGSDQVGSVTQIYTVSGLSVSGSVIAQAVTFVATPSSAILSAGSAGNYNFIYTASSNTVAKANLAITAQESLSGNTYNGSAYTGTYSTNFLGNDLTSATITGAATGTNVGTYASNLAVTGGVLNNYNTPVITNANFVVSPKPITISGITATGKIYDSNNTVTLNKPEVATLGFISRDGISINTIGVFDNVNVGTQTVTLTQSYGGTTSNYAITNQSTKPTASITPKALTIGSATAVNKVYDGTNEAFISSLGSLSGMIGTQTLNVAVNKALFDSEDVGNGRVATISYALSNGSNGGRASNYSLADTTTTANIGKRTITISGIVAANKVYDGTNSVTLIKPSVTSLGFHTRDNIVITTTGTFDAVDLGMQTVTLVQSYSGTVSNYNIINQTIKPRAAITELIVNKVINNRPAPNHNFITIQLSIMTGREFMPLNPMARFKLPDDNRAQTFKDNNINVQNMNIVNMNPPPPNTNFTQNNNFINPRVAQPIIVQPDTSNLKPMMLPKFDNVFKKSPFSFLGIDLDVDNEVLKDIKLNKIFIDGGAKSNGNVIGIELN
jgi:autotransporter-associated beta strand protein